MGAYFTTSGRRARDMSHWVIVALKRRARCTCSRASERPSESDRHRILRLNRCTSRYVERRARRRPRRLRRKELCTTRGGHIPDGLRSTPTVALWIMRLQRRRPRHRKMTTVSHCILHTGGTRPTCFGKGVLYPAATWHVRHRLGATGRAIKVDVGVEGDAAVPRRGSARNFVPMKVVTSSRSRSAIRTERLQRPAPSPPRQDDSGRRTSGMGGSDDVGPKPSPPRRSSRGLLRTRSATTPSRPDTLWRQIKEHTWWYGVSRRDRPRDRRHRHRGWD